MVSNKTIGVLILSLFLGVQMSFADNLKYWVFFKDKIGTPFKTIDPLAFLTSASVNRRVMYNIPITESDLPVSPTYINAVENISNSRVLYASKWMNGVVMEIESTELSNVLSQLASLPFVKNTSHVRRYMRSEPLPLPDMPPADTKGKSSRTSAIVALTRFDYGGSLSQIQQLGLDCLHERGYRGQGMTIAVCDAGFGFVNTNPIYDSLRARNGILGTRDFADGGTDVYSQSTHGSMVMSCMAANYPGLIVGTAPMANYWLMRTEEGRETISEEYNWIRAAEFADSVGADIITTSLGYTEFDDPAMNHKYQDLNGRTAPMSIAATMAARKGIIVLNAAGNERANSWHFISVPADADSIIAVGAVEPGGKDAPFSGVGPTSDGRIKPDLMARGAGTWVSVDKPEAFPGNGTSFACPVLAGAVACYWQAHKDYNNMRIIRDLKNRSDRADAPDNQYGWGIPNMCPQQNEFDFHVFSEDNSTIIVELTENSYSYVTVEVVDLAGRIHMSKEIPSTELTIMIDASTLVDGVYVIRVKTSAGSQSKKILKG